MELTDILQCPKTGNRLRFDGTASLLRGEHADLGYPTIDGVLLDVPVAPFFTFDGMARQFEGYTITRQGSDKCFAWFDAIKQGV